jgi:Pyrimidine dimer DNA glycosylase
LTCRGSCHLPDFAETARCLDDVRLGKQRVETYQIVRTLDGVTTGRRHHPAVRMWRGYEGTLVAYWTEPPDLPYVWPVPS